MPLTVPPKPAAQRQRRNRSTTARVVEAEQAGKPDLPTRYSELRCLHQVDDKRGCRLAGAHHDLKHFAESKVEPHDFEPAIKPWHPMCISWWNTIWSSPLSSEWVDADVPDLLALAALVDEFWNTNDVRVAAEIRMRNREFGLTPMARRSLQWEIVRTDDALERSRKRKPPTEPVADPRKLLKALG